MKKGQVISMNILVLTSVYPQPDDGRDIVTPTVKYFCDKWALDNQVIVVHNNSSFPLPFYYIPTGLRRKLESLLGHNFPTRSSRKRIHRYENNVNIFRLPIKKVFPHTSFSKRRINNQVDEIKSILAEENFIPDLIIAHWLNPQLDLLIPLKESYGARTSLVFHGDCTPNTIKQFDIKNRIKYVDAIGCRNLPYAKEVKNLLNLSNIPFICYSGIPDNEIVDNKIINNLQLDNSLSFCYVGRLVKYKNVDVVLRALHEVFHDSDYVFNIVGDGAEFDELQNLAKEIGAENNVVFHGQQSRDYVFSLLKQSTYFIMISNHETFGMVYLEAMLAGCITIASINGGMDGIIKNGYNGFLTGEGDFNSLKQLLMDIGSYSDEQLESLRKNAMCTASSFSDSNVAAHYLESVSNWKNE